MEYRGDNLLPPPELLRADAVGGKETSEGLVLEVKRRETAAAVSQMKERLRAMGILEATRKLQPTVTEKHIVKDDSKSVDKLEEVHEVVYPPPPPFEEIIKGKQNSNDGDEAYDTASTVSDDSPVVRKKGSASKNVANEMESQDPAFISALLKKKASDYKTVLR